MGNGSYFDDKAPSFEKEQRFLHHWRQHRMERGELVRSRSRLRWDWKVGVMLLIEKLQFQE